MSKAILVMLDGLRPDAIPIARCPNLRALITRGASTLRAQSVMPSVTLPCHLSIFHSIPPTRHGITTNEWMPMARPVASLVDMASILFRRCAFFYNWEPLRNLGRPGSLDFALYRKTVRNRDGDQIIAEDAARHIAEFGFDFAFVYFGTIDEWGHDHGWMSDEYLKQIENVDGALGTVLAALPDDYTILAQADHGGHDRFHGTDLPEDMLIPWIITGPGIRQGHTIETPVSLLDTAPTLAHILGFNSHPQWEGRVVTEIFL